MGALFVTSTGTGIGKTFLTVALVRHFRAQGRAVEAFKPVLSGFDPGNIDGSDSAELLRALGKSLVREEFDRISPWRFFAPLSPDMAASREGRHIDFPALVDFSKAAMQSAEAVLIEGVGGIMAPLDDRHTVFDWIRALHVPIILVVGSYLGTISHTLSALEVLRHHRIQIRAVVVSESKESPVALNETVSSIARFARDVDVVALSRSDASQENAIGRIASHVES